MSKGKERSYVQLVLKDSAYDIEACRLEDKIKKTTDLDTGPIKIGRIFQFLDDFSHEALFRFANAALKNPVVHDVYINRLFHSPLYSSYILVAKRSGVTDDEGMSAQKAFADFFQEGYELGRQRIFSQKIYLLGNPLAIGDLDKIACNVGNPLIHRFKRGLWKGRADLFPKEAFETSSRVDVLNIFLSDDDLLSLSKSRHLCLDLKEMQAIRDYFRDNKVKNFRKSKGLSENPTDCELEILAQTWSEHCKHKEFNAVIEYRDLDTGECKTIDSLFESKIKKATAEIQRKLEENGHNWLVKVFSDNAGVVGIDESRLFVWKVETHNTPSALDPYGGAITGILGNNRDILGTGVGGAKLLFNTNVLCFADPFYKKPLLKGQLHPSRILEGVVEGIMDGGNKSGVPTVNGSIVFDDRFCGKPLVFCGSGGIMPRKVNGKETWRKPVQEGDHIVMIGGRVGKDGIHGATLSSSHIDASTPATIVQIGSPMTQKILSDFLEKASLRGLINASTDNGAGGLSSSVGEMAQITNGAEVYLERVPLKYSGLHPWEIFVSESQERMTLSVSSEKMEDLTRMAGEFSLEISQIGFFTSSGFLEVKRFEKTIAYLDLHFLHNGTPKKCLQAEWKRNPLKEPVLPDVLDYNGLLLKLLRSPNICSKESVIRRYDHEVKGKSVVKPLMGANGDSPQDAAVLLLDHRSWKGLAVSNGIIPRYGDIDAYHMSAGAFDEAVRQIIAVGGKLPELSEEDMPFWSVNDNFCVPNSSFDPVDNPEGKYKLAQLVRMCDALYDMSVAYNIPMTSGKDSMKNDFRDGDLKISIPPTVLYSMVSRIDDIRMLTTVEFKAPGDNIYLLGNTYDELGASEFYRLFDRLGANVPKVRVNDASRLYHRLSLVRSMKLIESCHDISDGGLAVCLAECAFGNSLGLNVDLSSKKAFVSLFSESHSRFVVSVRKELSSTFERLMGEDCRHLGETTENGRMLVRWEGKSIIDIGVEELLSAWKGGLNF